LRGLGLGADISIDFVIVMPVIMGLAKNYNEFLALQFHRR